MTPESKTIVIADFNPQIKTYILIVMALIMTISLIGIPFIIIWFLGIGQYYSKRYYENLICELTTRNLTFKKGVMFKVEKTIPLENIQDLTFIENPLLKAFDLRILKIETAGQSNPQGSDMKLIGILDSSDFKNKVIKQRELLNSEVIASPEANMSGQDQILDVLKEIRNLLKDISKK